MKAISLREFPQGTTFWLALNRMIFEGVRAQYYELLSRRSRCIDTLAEEWIDCNQVRANRVDDFDTTAVSDHILCTVP